MAQLLTSIIFRSFKEDGTVNALGSVATYAAGGLVPAATYTTRAGDVENENPVPLSADGAAEIWLDPSQTYRFIELDADDTPIPGRDVDGISVPTSGADLAGTGDDEGARIVGFRQAGTGAGTTGTAHDKLREVRKSVEDFGGVADGTTNNDTAIAAAAAASGGRFHFPGPGTYVCSSSVWAYAFTAGDNVTLKVGGTDYVVSNAIAGPWRMTVDSDVLMSLRHAVTGNIVQQWQNGASGTATYFYRGLSIQTDSHSIQMAPSTNGGSCDFLWQRSTANADPAGNRFNMTFDEANDRLLFSYATTASGAPSFDTWMVPIAGTSPSLTFPAIRPMFNQGWEVKQRASGGFHLRMEQTSSTVATLKQIDGSATEFFRFRDNAIGVFGSAGTSRITLPAAAVDEPSSRALSNALRAAMIAFGWCD